MNEEKNYNNKPHKIFVMSLWTFIKDIIFSIQPYLQVNMFILKQVNNTTPLIYSTQSNFVNWVAFSIKNQVDYGFKFMQGEQI